MGDRRLKNVGLLLEWVPSASAHLLARDAVLLANQITKGCGAAACTTLFCASNPSFEALPIGAEAAAQARKLAVSGVGPGPMCPRILFKDMLTRLHRQLTAGCKAQGCGHPMCAANPQVTARPPNDAAKEAIAILQQGVHSAAVESALCPNMLPPPVGGTPPRYLVAVSLAEGETLRRVLHSRQRVSNFAGIGLRTADGALIDRSARFQEEPEGGAMVATGVQCLRFFNCDMYYTAPELQLLLEGLSESSVPDRVSFFGECLRLRRRERNLWGDTPLAKALTVPDDWHLLGARAKLEQVSSAMRTAARTRRADPVSAFHACDTDLDGKLTFAEVQRALDTMHLGFSPLDIAEVSRLVDQDGDGLVSLAEYCDAFGLGDPSEQQAAAPEAEEGTVNQKWQCQNCTFINDIRQLTCTMCELGWSGRRECPQGKWTCGVENGGCSFFNPNGQFYCEMCNRSRPDLASVRF